MSRAYRIRVKESISHDVVASDEICSDLEILEILPADQMSDLLKGELQGRGYEEKEGKMVKEQNGIRISVDTKSGEVSIKSEMTETITVECEKEGYGYDDVGPSKQTIEKFLSDQAKAEAQRRAEKQKEIVQNEAAEKLEGIMGDVRKELNDAVNSVTREALKRKAASLGTIKEMSEDPEAGSLTIKVEV